MIDLSAYPSRVTVGSGTAVRIRVSNRSGGPCGNILVDLDLPAPLELRHGRRRVRLRQLPAAEFHEEELLLVARQAGRHIIDVPNLSFLDEFGRPHRIRDAQIAVLAEPGRQEPQQDSVFISYRRADTRTTARSLAADLDRAFRCVFLDHASLRPGDDFRRRLDRELGSCTVFLALLGPRWLSLLTTRTARGVEDLVLHEVATALRRRVIVIPVLVGGARPPARSELPPELVELADRQTLRLHRDDPEGRAALVDALRSVCRR